jgi:peptide/nickel transport system permease protein
MKRKNHIDPQARAHYARLLAEALSRLWAFARLRPVATLATVVLVALVTVALGADVIATHDPLAQNVAHRLWPPGPDHYFGTDGFGRDIFSRVVHGSRVSLYVGLLAVSLATVVGTWVGTVSAYRGGTFDLVVQRVIDALLGFPFLVLALIMVVALGSSPTSVAMAIALALAPQVARLSRASALSTKGEPYMEAARVIGASPYRIIWRHLLPSSFPPVLAQVTGYFGAAVVAETALSFLGLGVPPPFPSWGRMLQEGARQYFEAAPWATVFPGLALSVTVLSSALLGDAIRDLLDPRQRLSRRDWLPGLEPGPGERGRR